MLWVTSKCNVLKTSRCALRHIRVSDTNTDKTKRERQQNSSLFQLDKTHRDNLKIMTQIKTDDTKVRQQA